MPTLRINEALLANCITFIDCEFDSDKKIHSEKFCYVSCGAELKEKILQLKEDCDLKNSILKAQHEIVFEKRKNPMINKFMEVLSKYE